MLETNMCYSTILLYNKTFWKTSYHTQSLRKTFLTVLTIIKCVKNTLYYTNIGVYFNIISMNN